MEQSDILAVLNKHYPMRFSALQFMRNAGSMSYTALADEKKYFLRITKPALSDSVSRSLDIHVFLLTQGFPVPPIIHTNAHLPCVPVSREDGEHFFILYEFIEGEEVKPDRDAEAIGGLIGRFHSIMRGYPGSLIKRDKHYYIDKYLDQLRQKQYPRANEFAAYGEALWERVGDLPRGYCHGDLYSGNIHKTPDGRMYVLDFDTSCNGFPMYDPVLICNRTHYFSFDEAGYDKSTQVFARFLPEYLKHNNLCQNEIDAFYDLLALYHFALQAMVIENNGLDCVDHAFLDRQIDWLYKWREQCAQYQ